MRIGSPVSIQPPLHYAGRYATPPRAIPLRAPEPRRVARTLAPRRTDDAAQLTLLMAQAMGEPRRADPAAGLAAYAAAQRDDDPIFFSIRA